VSGARRQHRPAASRGRERPRPRRGHWFKSSIAHQYDWTSHDRKWSSCGAEFVWFSVPGRGVRRRGCGFAGSRGGCRRAGSRGLGELGSGSTYGTVTPKDGVRSGTLDGYYWLRDVQSGPPLGPSSSKGSEAGCRLSSGSSRRSKCAPPRFVRGGRAAGRRRSVPNGDSRRVSGAESSRSRRARRGSVDVSVGMFGGPSL
jgi:hypothetical protein